MSRSEHTSWRSPSSPAHRHPTSTGAHRAVKRATRRGPGPKGQNSSIGVNGVNGRAATALATDTVPGRGPGPTASTVPQEPPPLYEPYLDGLFTYCLSVLCEHDTATAALGDMLAVAERHRGRLRDPELRRAWFYALARWACLRRLAEGRPAAGSPETSRSVADERRRELAALAWPEAAGTTPEQREALELAVRHQLSAREIAAVLGVERDTARSLLSRAACEVERTRTALAVVELGSCPAVARLSGDTQVLLGTALRREIVRHVDECPACRLTAEQAVAAGPWPGTATPAVLAVVEAPRSAACAAMLHAMRAIRSAGRSGGHVPHFDRRGFPLDMKDRAARRSLIRHRAVTTTVVAAVVAAPALALWAAYRNAPHTGEAQDTTSVSATDTDGVNPSDYGYVYEKTGPGKSAGHHHATGTPGTTPTPKAATSADGSAGSSLAPGTPHPTASSAPSSPSPGWITVAAQPQGPDTQITVTDEGGSPVHWTASTSAYWLHLSSTSGTLQPGHSVAITAVVDQAAQPAGPWRARITFEPSGSTVTIEGQGPSPSPSGSPTPTPSPSPSGSSDPTPKTS